jgi:hypothetical protein
MTEAIGFESESRLKPKPWPAESKPSGSTDAALN